MLEKLTLTWWLLTVLPTWVYMFVHMSCAFIFVLINDDDNWIVCNFRFAVVSRALPRDGPRDAARPVTPSHRATLVVSEETARPPGDMDTLTSLAAVCYALEVGHFMLILIVWYKYKYSKIPVSVRCQAAPHVNEPLYSKICSPTVC